MKEQKYMARRDEHLGMEREHRMKEHLEEEYKRHSPHREHAMKMHEMREERQKMRK